MGTTTPQLTPLRQAFLLALARARFLTMADWAAYRAGVLGQPIADAHTQRRLVAPLCAGPRALVGSLRVPDAGDAAHYYLTPDGVRAAAALEGRGAADYAASYALSADDLALCLPRLAHASRARRAVFALLGRLAVEGWRVGAWRTGPVAWRRGQGRATRYDLQVDADLTLVDPRGLMRRFVVLVDDDLALPATIAATTLERLLADGHERGRDGRRGRATGAGQDAGVIPLVLTCQAGRARCFPPAPRDTAGRTNPSVVSYLWTTLEAVSGPVGLRADTSPDLPLLHWHEPRAIVDSEPEGDIFPCGSGAVLTQRLAVAGALLADHPAATTDDMDESSGAGPDDGLGGDTHCGAVRAVRGAGPRRGSTDLTRPLTLPDGLSGWRGRTGRLRAAYPGRPAAGGLRRGDIYAAALVYPARFWSILAEIAAHPLLDVALLCRVALIRADWRDGTSTGADHVRPVGRDDLVALLRLAVMDGLVWETHTDLARPAAGDDAHEEGGHLPAVGVGVRYTATGRAITLLAARAGLSPSLYIAATGARYEHPRWLDRARRYPHWAAFQAWYPRLETLLLDADDPDADPRVAGWVQALYRATLDRRPLTKESVWQTLRRAHPCLRALDDHYPAYAGLLRGRVGEQARRTGLAGTPLITAAATALALHRRLPSALGPFVLRRGVRGPYRLIPATALDNDHTLGLTPFGREQVEQARREGRFAIVDGRDPSRVTVSTVTYGRALAALWGLDGALALAGLDDPRYRDPLTRTLHMMLEERPLRLRATRYRRRPVWRREEPRALALWDARAHLAHTDMGLRLYAAARDIEVAGGWSIAEWMGEWGAVQAPWAAVQAGEGARAYKPDAAITLVQASGRVVCAYVECDRTPLHAYLRHAKDKEEFGAKLGLLAETAHADRSRNRDLLVVSYPYADQAAVSRDLIVPPGPGTDRAWAGVPFLDMARIRQIAVWAATQQRRRVVIATMPVLRAHGIAERAWWEVGAGAFAHWTALFPEQSALGATDEAPHGSTEGTTATCYRRRGTGDHSSVAR